VGIIRCLHSEIAIIAGIVTNFQICGRQAALTSIQLNPIQNLGHNSATSPEYKSAGRERYYDAASD